MVKRTIRFVKRTLGLVLILVGAIALSWVAFYYLSAAWFDREAR